jgi:MFS transporter, DHA3 family, macrolide efflux protein
VRRNSLMQDMAYGWSFIQARPALLGMLLSSILPNLVLGLVSVLITPLVLSFANEATLGVVLSLSGLGMLVGGLVMSVWGGPQRLVRGIFAFQLLGSFALLGGALPASVPVVTLGAGLLLATVPLMAGTLQNLWQRKTPQEMQGRVFSVRRMIARTATPVASLLAGPLADRFFEPWLAPGGALAGSIGRVVGVGRGRGIGFLFVVLGGVMALNVLVTWLSPRVRNMEAELPDALPDPTPVTHLPGTPAGDEATPALAPASGSSTT